MRSDLIRGDSLWDVGSTNDQGHVDIFFVSTFLPGWQPVLANMIPVIARIDDISVIQYAVLFKKAEDVINKLVDCLKCPKAGTIELVVILNLYTRLLGQLADPADSAGLDICELMRSDSNGMSSPCLD